MFFDIYISFHVVPLSGPEWFMLSLLYLQWLEQTQEITFPTVEMLSKCRGPGTSARNLAMSDQKVVVQEIFQIGTN